MPEVRKPVSASTISFMPSHIRRLSMASGNSRGSRAIFRHQPQLRLDCSWAMCPFSHSATETPFRAKNNALLVPMIPPPTMTTSTRVFTPIGNGLFDFGIGESGIDRLVERIDDWRSRILGGDNAHPAERFIAGYKLGNGRHIRQLPRRPLGSGGFPAASPL